MVSFPVVIHDVTAGFFALLSSVVSSLVGVRCDLCAAAGLPSTARQEEWRIVHAELSGGKLLAGWSIIFTRCPEAGFCRCEWWL